MGAEHQPANDQDYHVRGGGGVFALSAEGISSAFRPAPRIRVGRNEFQQGATHSPSGHGIAPDKPALKRKPAVGDETARVTS
jgi:hypothetical protein